VSRRNFNDALPVDLPPKQNVHLIEGFLIHVAAGAAEK
jgi:hypothetical protein